jgi:hypothetical protein
MRKRFSPGVVLGLIAVVLAMSGSAYAASKVTSAQIKDDTITTKDIKDHSIRGRDVENASMTADVLTQGALDELQGAAGPTGPAGPAGAAGAAGPAGPSVISKMTPVKALASLVAGDTDIFTVACPAGMSVVNGGFTIFLGDVWLNKTYDGRSWSVGISNFYGTIASTGNEIWGFCAPTGSAIAGISTKSAAVTKSTRDALIKADIAKYKAAQ